MRTGKIKLSRSCTAFRVGTRVSGGAGDATGSLPVPKSEDCSGVTPPGRDEVEDSSPAMVKTPVTPVAVIGMACRLPGGIDSPEQLWEALLRGDDLVTEIPPDRWDADEYYDPEPGAPGRSVCKWGAFLDDVAGFDPEFFGITEKEATAMDPQHRLLLETSWEAMEHGGLTRTTLADSRTGVFMGLMHDDYQFVHAEANALEGPYGYMRQQLRHGLRADRLHDGAARSGDDGGHRVLVRPGCGARGLSQLA